ncbi:hypothetical protein [Mycoplasmoides pirum]|uniref:hypothetical protein n=1 Tax=Mycoplasmoides pirum TaxID=2122 RepID=UPI0004862C60|nr:hypothetical protein [Mycoplasmoides pirum]
MLTNSQNELIKEISKTPQGSIQITYSALQNAIFNFVNFILNSKKNNSYTLTSVEFIEFQHNTNFQVNVFLDLKSKVKLNFEIHKQIQKGVISYLNNEFKIEALTINVICNMNN